MQPRLVAIVVYFRTGPSLTICLHALQTQKLPPDEIIVIDNSSTVDGLDKRPAPGEDWRWVRAEHNLGFGAACNLGAQISHSDYLLFLNADVVLCDDALEQLCLAADSAPKAGAIGPRIYGRDGRIELSARAFPSVKTGILGRSSLLTHVLARLGRTPSDVSAALGKARRVDWISGACMLIPSKAFDQIGGFDENFWMYWEDADLCHRLADSGWEVIFYPAAQVHHSTGSSGQSRRTIEAFHMSAAHYFERHIARSAAIMWLVRGILKARMSIMLHLYAHRAAD